MAETIISPNNVYELTLPDGYKLEENEEAVIVYNEGNGSGAINITSYQIPDDYVFDIEEELRDFVSSVDNNINAQTLQITSNGYAYSEITTQGRFWKIWTFFKSPNAVFASYNCDEKDKGNEIDKVDKIMHSLKIIY